MWLAQHEWATFRREKGVKNEAGTSAAAKNHPRMDVALFRRLRRWFLAGRRQEKARKSTYE
jgi:hypothetical protein